MPLNASGAGIIAAMPTVSFSRARRLAKALLPFSRRPKVHLETLPCIPVPASAFETLLGPEAFRHKLLELIAHAKTRILISALYLQDDDAGREVLAALYAAKEEQPGLQIAVLVDWHRAQRGLIGKARSAGNAAMYKEMAARLGHGVPIYGVPVQTRELLGVLHLKGFVLDEIVLYSGASLNDVYLQKHARYRLDRYHVIHNRVLADSVADLMTQVLLPEPAVHAFDGRLGLSKPALRAAIGHLRRSLKKARYTFTAGELKHGEIGVTPLLGLGRLGNELNAIILQLVQHTQDHLLLFTPYFNLPRALQKAIRERLRAGCKVTIVLGDKVANDFYIPPSETFKSIGILPYLYETNLRRFCKVHHRAIDQGLLNIYLWRDGDNTFHLKGILADGRFALLTGNNLNPRAWGLDLENGLLIRDPHRLLLHQHERERDLILRHARRLTHYKELEAMDDYPAPAKRLLKRLTRPRIDRLINRVM
jgi:CDP-diacylglycerol---serine O-phosphatidyltransferase